MTVRITKKRHRAEHTISTMAFAPRIDKHPSTTSLLTALLVGAMAIGGANAFQPSSRSHPRNNPLQGIPTKQNSRRLKAWNHHTDNSTFSHNRNIFSPSFRPNTSTTTAGLTTGSVLASAALLMNDPVVEAHVLTDVAHVGLDLAVFMGQGVLALRLAAVIGRT